MSNKIENGNTTQAAAEDRSRETTAESTNNSQSAVIEELDAMDAIDLDSVDIDNHPRTSLLLKVPKLVYYYSITVVIISFFALFYFIISRNPSIFEISKTTISLLNHVVEAIVVLTIAFVLGCFGGFTRLLAAGEKLEGHLKIVAFSGFMAMISWMGLKSKIVLALLTSYLNQNETPNIDELSLPSESTFYSMALIAVVVGMFSSNIFLYIEQRVKMMTAKNGNDLDPTSQKKDDLSQKATDKS